MRRNATRIAARFRHYISSPKSNMPAGEPLMSKGTVLHTSNCEFLLQIHHFPSFWKSLSSTKLIYTPTLSATYALTISDRGQGSLNADVSGNTLPFVSQSINNFSDYDISQSVDWENPTRRDKHRSIPVCLHFRSKVARTCLQFPLSILFLFRLSCL